MFTKTPNTEELTLVLVRDTGPNVTLSQDVRPRRVLKGLGKVYKGETIQLYLNGLLMMEHEDADYTLTREGYIKTRIPMRESSSIRLFVWRELGN